MDTLTGFAIIIGVGIVAIVVTLFVVVRVWAQSKQPRRVVVTPSALASSHGVQVIYAGAGKPLVWMVGEQTYTHPADVADPRAQAVLREFFAAIRPIVSPPALTVVPTAAMVTPAAAPAKIEKPIAEPSLPDYAARFDTLAATESVAPAQRSAESSVASLAPEMTAASEPLPAGLAPSPPVRRTFEEELELPLFERLRSSFFGGNTQPGKAYNLDNLERAPQAAILNIDDLDPILQARLAEVPGAPDAYIRSGPGGLLQIVVGGRIYDRVDDVPSEAVRDAMRQAIQTWERRIG